MEPIDILYGYDLKNPVTQKEILDRIKELKRRFGHSESKMQSMEPDATYQSER